MALVSPGVQVSVIDESFYTPAEPGTVPCIFIATAQDKTSSSGTGTAQGLSLHLVHNGLIHTYLPALFYPFSLACNTARIR